MSLFFIPDSLFHCDFSLLHSDGLSDQWINFAGSDEGDRVLHKTELDPIDQRQSLGQRRRPKLQWNRDCFWISDWLDLRSLNRKGANGFSCLIKMECN